MRAYRIQRCGSGDGIVLQSVPGGVSEASKWGGLEMRYVPSLLVLSRTGK